MSLCDYCNDDCEDARRCTKGDRLARWAREFRMREDLNGRLEYQEVNENEKKS